jgi:lipid-binding SYLF domain-containing protein
MTRPILSVLAIVFAITAIVSPLRAQDTSDEAKRQRDAAVVLDEIMAAADKAIPASVLEKAVGIAVFPGLLKGGLGVGAQHGRGVLSARDKKGGWSNPAFLTINGGSIGLQIGLQSTDLVLVVNNRRGLEQMVKNQFKIGADVAAAAGPVGRDAGAATDIQMRAQILTYSRTRGLFAGVTLNGSTINQDKDANERFYGKPLTTSEIVFDGMGTANEAVNAWKATLVKYAK